MRYFLTGFMGSGKTSIAALLANALHLPFVDLDEEIEKSSGCPIALIFKSAGEHKFREREKQQLEKTIAAFQDAVIAVGGGAPCFGDNARLMEQSGKVIYLKCGAEVLAKRLASQRANRPLLSETPEANLQEIITDMLKARKSYYEKAAIIVDAEKEPADVLKEIMVKLTKNE